MKAIMREMKNTVLQYTDIEVKVREATSSDPWGASSTLMSEIARATFDYQEYVKLAALLWKRLLDYEHVMHVQKALILVEYLLRNGSESFITDCKRRARDIADLKKYKHYDSNNQDDGKEVRAKAKAVYDLLMDDAKLTEEREKAAKIRDVRLTAFGSNYYPSSDSFGARRSSNVESYEAPRRVSAEEETSQRRDSRSSHEHHEHKERERKPKKAVVPKEKKSVNAADDFDAAFEEIENEQRSKETKQKQKSQTDEAKEELPAPPSNEKPKKKKKSIQPAAEDDDPFATAVPSQPVSASAAYLSAVNTPPQPKDVSKANRRRSSQVQPNVQAAQPRSQPTNLDAFANFDVDTSAPSQPKPTVAPSEIDFLSSAPQQPKAAEPSFVDFFAAAPAHKPAEAAKTKPSQQAAISPQNPNRTINMFDSLSLDDKSSASKSGDLWSADLLNLDNIKKEHKVSRPVNNGPTLSDLRSNIVSGGTVNASLFDVASSPPSSTVPSNSTSSSSSTDTLASLYSQPAAPKPQPAVAFPSYPYQQPMYQPQPMYGQMAYYAPQPMYQPQPFASQPSLAPQPSLDIFSSPLQPTQPKNTADMFNFQVTAAGKHPQPAQQQVNKNLTSDPFSGLL